MWSNSNGRVVVMIVFTGCLAFVIFPASQAPHKWSLRNLTFSMPMTCFFFASVCKFLMPTWPSCRCHSQPSDFCLCQRRWYASDAMEIREHPSIYSCHQSCDLYIHYRGPTHLLWVDHPADELVQLTNSYTSSVKNMTSISSDQFHQVTEHIKQYEDVRNESSFLHD